MSRVMEDILITRQNGQATACKVMQDEPAKKTTIDRSSDTAACWATLAAFGMTMSEVS